MDRNAAPPKHIHVSSVCVCNGVCVLCVHDCVCACVHVRSQVYYIFSPNLTLSLLAMWGHFAGPPNFKGLFEG